MSKTFRVYDTFTHRDGTVTREFLWCRIESGKERKYLGLCSEMTEQEARNA